MAAGFVQTRSVGPSTDPTALAFNSNVASGDTLYALVVVADGTTPTVTGVTDSLGNTWALVAGSTTPSFRIELWKAPSGSAGACTVTVDYSSAPANSGLLTIFEFSGQGTTTNGASNTLDQSVAQDPMTCATLSVTGAGVVFCGVRMDTSYALTAWGGSFNDAGTGTRARSGYRIVTGALTASPTMDCVVAEAGESLTVVVYDQSVGGGNRRRRVLLGAAA